MPLVFALRDEDMDVQLDLLSHANIWDDQPGGQINIYTYIY